MLERVAALAACRPATPWWEQLNKIDAGLLRGLGDGFLAFDKRLRCLIGIRTMVALGVW